MPMRWRFADSPGAEERGRKDQQVSIASWWREFDRRHEDISALFSGKAKWDLPAWMAKHLQTIHPELMWEFGPAIKGKGDRLVITPENRHCLRPLVDEILRTAPSITGWEFYGHRVPESLEQAAQTVKARTGKDLTLTVVAGARGKFNRIDVVFSAPALKTEKDCEQAGHQAFVVLESLLGEEILDRWIGTIDVVPWKDRPAQALPLKDLRGDIDRTIAAVRDSLPKDPLHRRTEGGKWTLFELKPADKEDYPAQDDMFVGKAMITELWKNGRSKVHFYSGRYSRAGETFCYVKLDGRQADLELFPDKASIEDALEKALRKADAGCYIGGGTGRIYSYVDLAITDMAKAVPIIRQTLQKGKVNRRSWILFYDSDLAWEWIGIWDDSPVPPRITGD